MVAELITLPLRVGVRATTLVLDTTGKAAERALSFAGQVAGTVASRATAAPEQEPAAAQDEGPPRSERQAQQEQAREPVAPSAPAPMPEAAPAPTVKSPPDRRGHVSEEPDLVQEVAERGAEEGAGAVVDVAEPWEGYGQMHAEQVIERLDTATPAELAAVRLYEGRNRGRETVLAAAERRLSAATGSGSPE